MPRGDYKKPKLRVKKSPAQQNGKKVAGAKTAYEPDRHPHDAYIACSRMGAEHKDLAALFEVHLSSIERWIGDYPQFRLAIRAGRDEWSSRHIEDSLKRRAMGFETVEVTESLKDGIKTVTKQVPPDVGACIFWLINRQKDRWQQMRNVVVTGKTETDFNVTTNHKISIANLDRSQLEQLRDIITIAKNVPALPAPVPGNGSEHIAGTGNGGNGTGDQVSKAVH